MNKWIGMGRLTKDIELQTTKGGTEYAKFSVAVNRKKDKNGDIKADFVDCTAFGKTAAFVQNYFKKGDGIVVEGRLESDTYDAKDGTKRTKWGVTVENVWFVPGKGKSGGAEQPAFTDIDPKDIPF